MRALLMIVVCGCYSPSVTSGLPCSDAGACPYGQKCSAAGFCGGDPTSPDAPLPGPTWSVPAKITQVSSTADDFGPSLFADGLRIYVASNRIADFRIYYATRNSTTQTFSMPAPSLELDAAGTEYDVDVSAAGLEIHYVSSNPPKGVRRGTRTDTSTQYTGMAPVPALADREGPSLAVGDTRMMVSIKSGGIEEYGRATASDANWTLVRVHSALATYVYPGISSDGLELYATEVSSEHLFRSTRISLDDEFGTPVPVMFGNPFDAKPIYDPELTPDGRTMYLAIKEGASFDIFVTTR